MLKGIDVSYWKRDLLVGSVAADFIIAKATGGTGYVDPTCDMFVQAAIVHGKKWGVYHYYSDGFGGDDAIAEADYFINNCLGYIGKGILVLDWEAGGNNYWRDVNRAKMFLDRVYQRTGVRPIIYMSNSVVNSLDWSSVINAGYGLWVAGWPNNNDVVPNYNMDPYKDPAPKWDGVVGNVLWQFTSTGRIDGYGGNLDCNFFYGTVDTWDAYARPVTPPTPPQPEPQPTTTTTTTQAPEPTTTTTTQAPIPEPTTTTTTTEKPADKPNPLATISKAIAGFLAGIIVVWAAKHGITIEGDLAGLFTALLGGAFTALTVFFAPKNKE